MIRDYSYLGDDPAAAVSATRTQPSASSKGQVPALHLTGLYKAFGQTIAVDHLDLNVPAGSFFGLVGPNGAGKTTSLSMAAGLLRPDAGGFGSLASISGKSQYTQNN
jgi:ABC-2 type transport system ATP-binding protein